MPIFLNFRLSTKAYFSRQVMTNPLFKHLNANISLPRAFPGGSVVKNSPPNTGDLGSILGLARFPGEGNDNILQYSCLGTPMDGEAW